MNAAGHIRVIDAGTWTPGYTSVYLIIDDRVVLVDTGLSSSADVILEGIRNAGVRPEEVCHILVTHLHLDHAGSAGILARALPRADVLAHPMGVKHLVDPSRLLRSSEKALGQFASTYNLDRVIGIPAERVTAVTEGQVIDLGRTTLTIMETPGHAPHSLCIRERATNGVFIGDEIGMRLVEGGPVTLTTPAPGFNMEQCLKSIERLEALHPEVLYFAHFGPSRDVAAVLEGARLKLHSWAGLVQGALDQGRDAGYLARLICQDLEGAAPSAPKWLNEQMAEAFAMGFLKYARERAALQ